jgi:hypothetical protein
MTTPPFSIPSSMNLRELLDCIDARMASLDLLEQSVHRHQENLVVMGKHLEVQHKLLQQMVDELQGPIRGLHAVAAQSDTEPAKKTSRTKGRG